MNVTNFPLVKDLTEGGRRLPIESDGSPVYDLILTIWQVFDESEDDSAFELGRDWFESVAEATPSDLAAELVYLGGAGCSVWLGLMGLIASSPHPHDIDSVLSHLAGIDPLYLRRTLLGYKLDDDRIPAEQIDRAAAGDKEALEQLLASAHLTEDPAIGARYRQVFGLAGTELRDRIVVALRRFREEVYHPFEQEFGPATIRAAAARRALVRGAEVEAVIEEVTNGLDYRIQPGVGRVVLVPSVVLRPWALIDKHNQTLVVGYPVADEFIDADPDAPPSWVVKLHKALGDEKRLRILRRLSESGATLDDLADMLGLSKSTVHHHVGQLRAAGLVRVRVESDDHQKKYNLRPSVLFDARQTLDDYLGAAGGLSTTPRSEQR